MPTTSSQSIATPETEQLLSTQLSADAGLERNTAERIMEKLAATYPPLRAAIFDSPRLAGALEAVARTTDLDHEHIFEALTAREMATAQRPIGVLISRCTELLEAPAPTVEQSQSEAISVEIAESRTLTLVHDLAESRRTSPTEAATPEVPEVVPADVAQPDVAQPDVAQPDVAQPDVAQPDVAQPDVAEVDVAQPDGASADGAQPDGAPADGAQPDVAEVDVAPVARPDFVPGLIRAEHRAQPTRGFRKVLCRSSFGLLNPGPGRRELQEIEVMKRITAPFRGSRNIVMLSIKGGVGKTTVSLGLGHTFATHRNDRIVAIDASPDPGTLGQRVAGRGGSIRDLVGMKNVASYADIQALSTQQSTGLEIISSDRLFEGNASVTSDDYRHAVECLSSYFNLVMTDCGAGVPTASLHSLLEVADQVVIVTAPMVDAGWSTGLLLDCLDDGGLGLLVSNATVVVNHVQQRVQVDEDEFDSYFASRCRAVVHLPWDENLASGGSMQLDQLRAATRNAYRHLAAIIADGLVS
jgi:MinD-like ATPase involved in chromosome partitioning or flagellar assembly